MIPAAMFRSGRCRLSVLVIVFRLVCVSARMPSFGRRREVDGMVALGFGGVCFERLASSSVSRPPSFFSRVSL